MKKLFWAFTISFLLLSGFSQGIVLADEYYVDAGLGTDDPSYGGRLVCVSVIKRGGTVMTGFPS
jgi:hypothetical protein